MRLTLRQEYQKKSEEMYQELMHAISRCDGDKMEALVRLTLPELRWLESQMWRLRRVFLDQTDVLDREGKTAFILMTVETILGKVLCAFSEKYLDQENESKLSFLTSSEGVFNG